MARAIPVVPTRACGVGRARRRWGLDSKSPEMDRSPATLQSFPTPTAHNPPSS